MKAIYNTLNMKEFIEATISEVLRIVIAAFPY